MFKMGEGMLVSIVDMGVGFIGFGRRKIGGWFSVDSDRRSW